MDGTPLLLNAIPNNLQPPPMVLIRSLVRIGGRRVVLSRSLATQRCYIPLLRAPTRTPDVRSPWSRGRGLATASAVARLEDTSVDLPSRVGSSSTAIAQTNENQDVLAKLVGIRELLVDELGGSEEWVERVDSAIEDLGGDRTPTLGIYGDPLSSPAILLTSLLLDPLSEDSATYEAIISRHDEGGKGSRLIISGRSHSTGGKDETVKRDVGSLEGEIGWLRESGMQVMEVVDQHPSTILSQLLSSDFPTLIIDPIRLLSTPTLSFLLPYLITHPSLHLIINGVLPTPPSSNPLTTPRESTRKRLRRQLSSYTSRDNAEIISQRAVFVDAIAGVEAANALRDALVSTGGEKLNTERATAFRVYQERYLESNLAELKSVLGHLVTSEGGGNVKGKRAEQVAKITLSYIVAILGDLRNEIQTAESSVIALNQLVTSTKSACVERITSSEEMGKSVEDSKRRVEEVWRKRLGWGRVVVGGGGADGVVEELEEEVRVRWGRELGVKLAYDAGTLSTIQSDIFASTNHLLSSFSSSSSSPTPFYSAVLLNSLSQLSLSQVISPSLSLAPIERRRRQLLEHVIPGVFKKARQLVWTTYSVSFLAASTSWSLCVPLELISSEVAFGGFLLSSLATLRWAIGRWMRTRSRFWKDWQRVEGGLIDEVVEVQERETDKVVKVAEEGARGLEGLVERQRRRVEDVEGRVEGMRW